MRVKFSVLSAVHGIFLLAILYLYNGPLAPFFLIPFLCQENRTMSAN